MRIPFRYPVKVVPAFLFFSSFDEPKVLGPGGEVKVKPKGWRAVKQMFEFDEGGDIRPEMASTTTAFFSSFLCGAVYGGVTKSKFVFEDFIRNNHATAFQSHLEAKKALQSKVSLSFGGGAWYYGWRCSLFTGTFVFLANATALYRDKRGVLEYFTSGIIVGSLFRVHLGLPGMLVGGALGGFLGFIGGLITSAILWLGNFSLDDLQNVDYEWQKMRRQAIKNIEWEGSKENSPKIVVRKFDPEFKTGKLQEDDLNTVTKTTENTTKANTST